MQCVKCGKEIKNDIYFKINCVENENGYEDIYCEECYNEIRSLIDDIIDRTSEQIGN